MPVWRVADQAFATAAAAVVPCHIGLGPGLVEKDQLGHIKLGLKLVPEPARLGDIRAYLLGGLE